MKYYRRGRSGTAGEEGNSLRLLLNYQNEFGFGLNP